MNEIVWHNRARKQIRKIPAHYRELIFNLVDKLAEPEWTGLDVRELRGHRYQYRLRAGRYRVLFDHDTMNVHTEPQIIRQKGRPVFAVIPWEEYQNLLQSKGDQEVWFPNEVVKANACQGNQPDKSLAGISWPHPGRTGRSRSHETARAGPPGKLQLHTKSRNKRAISQGIGNYPGTVGGRIANLPHY